jgi:hypothetical protein
VSIESYERVLGGKGHNRKGLSSFIKVIRAVKSVMFGIELNI